MLNNNGTSKIVSREVIKVDLDFWKNSQSLKKELEEGKNEEVTTTLQVNDNHGSNIDTVNWIIQEIVRW